MFFFFNLVHRIATGPPVLLSGSLTFDEFGEALQKAKYSGPVLVYYRDGILKRAEVPNLANVRVIAGKSAECARLAQIS